MIDLTKLARGRECQIRIPGKCTGDSSTVVLCHYRMVGMTGPNYKIDWMGAWGCAACHAVCDSQHGSWVEFARDSRDVMLLEGVMRTLAILIDEGVIVVGGEIPKPSKIFKRRA